MRLPVSISLALLLCVGCAPSAKVEAYAQRIAPLIDPAKLATLGTRGANPRVQKYVHWLALAQLDKTDPAKVAERATALAGYRGKAAEMTVEAMLRNLDIATKLGCINDAGLDAMRHGRSPTVLNGPYAGDKLSVDHIVPRAVVPELDNVIANLELMPLRMNGVKTPRLANDSLTWRRSFIRPGS